MNDEQPKPTTKRGRPRATEPGSYVTTWLPASTHDRLIQLANRREVTVSAYVRQLVVFQVTPRPKP